MRRESLSVIEGRLNSSDYLQVLWYRQKKDHTLSSMAIRVTRTLQLELREFEALRARYARNIEGRRWGVKLLPAMVRYMTGMANLKRKKERSERIARWTALRSERNQTEM